MAQDDEKYVMEHDPHELGRLTDQPYLVREAMGGRFVYAPLELGRKGLRILDSATADGERCFHLFVLQLL